MRTLVDPQLLREAQEYRLRFACEDCAHHDRERVACSLGFPQDEHRTSTLAGTVVVFCKAFELG